MKKLLLGLIMLFVTVFVFGQSNRAGTIQVGLGGGIALGWTSFEYLNKTNTQNGVGVSGNFNIRGQYGISKKFSAGIILRKDWGVFSVSENDFEDSFEMSVSTFAFAFEGKIYLINKDKFNLNIAPSFGYTTGSTETIDVYPSDLEGDASGLNYGLTTGINLYFGSSSKYGMSADIGFAGNNLSGSFDNSNSEYKIRGANFYIGLGFSTRF